MPKKIKSKKEVAKVLETLKKDKRVDIGIVVLFILSFTAVPNLLFITLILMWFLASWKKDAKKLITFLFLGPIAALMLGSYLGSFYTLDVDTSVSLLNIITFWGSWTLILTFVGGIAAWLFKERLGLKYDKRKILMITFWILALEICLLLFSFIYAYQALGYYDIDPREVQMNLNG